MFGNSSNNGLFGNSSNNGLFGNALNVNLKQKTRTDFECLSNEYTVKENLKKELFALIDKYNQCNDKGKIQLIMCNHNEVEYWNNISKNKIKYIKNNNNILLINNEIKSYNYNKLIILLKLFMCINNDNVLNIIMNFAGKSLCQCMKYIDIKHSEYLNINYTNEFDKIQKIKKNIIKNKNKKKQLKKEEEELEIMIENNKRTIIDYKEELNIKRRKIEKDMTVFYKYTEKIYFE